MEDAMEHGDKIEKIVELSAPVARVWRALTDHEEFGQWFRVALDGPFEVGKITCGKITVPGYENVPWETLTERMEPERLFVFSWHVTEVDPSPKMMVAFKLEPAAKGTRLTITESGFSQLPDPQRLEILRQNEEGWEMQTRNIAAHVES